MLLGRWVVTGSRQNLSLGSDPTAPASPPTVVETRFPAGLRAGTGPVSWKGWEVGDPAAIQKSKLYLSFWVKINGTDYENEPVGTKFGFIGYGIRPGGPDNSLYFVLKGVGRRVAKPRFQIRAAQQQGTERSLVQNADGRPLMTVGEWHQWEALLELNDMGAANGVLRVWIDRTLVIDYRNVVYIKPDRPFGFYMWKWNPTWGGRGPEPRSRDDFVFIDQVYMSGVPFANAPVPKDRAPGGGNKTGNLEHERPDTGSNDN